MKVPKFLDERELAHLSKLMAPGATLVAWTNVTGNVWGGKRKIDDNFRFLAASFLKELNVSEDITDRRLYCGRKH